MATCGVSLFDIGMVAAAALAVLGIVSALSAPVAMLAVWAIARFRPKFGFVAMYLLLATLAGVVAYALVRSVSLPPLLAEPFGLVVAYAVAALLFSRLYYPPTDDPGSLFRQLGLGRAALACLLLVPLLVGQWAIIAYAWDRAGEFWPV